jgi:hypothetical protein
MYDSISDLQTDPKFSKQQFISEYSTTVDTMIAACRGEVSTS